MNRIPALVIDEDKRIVDAIVHLLMNHCDDVEVVATSTSVDQLDSMLANNKPYIVFIGFNLAKKIRFGQNERNEFLYPECCCCHGEFMNFW